MMVRRTEKMSELNRKQLPEYTIDYISAAMSLRKPQKQSVKILDSILDEIPLSKSTDLESAANAIHGIYPIFTSFEHDFMSLTFALATGVGKTKLMGAFMTYLYTNKGVRNFFVVAPNLTIYNKLKNDLGNPNPDNDKYVFKGVGCFAGRDPNIWIDEDYKNRPLNSITDNDSINIYIFNISKFNSDDRNIMSINEYLGQSFFDYLKGLDDLVIIMDESHHYRAKSSAKAINDLRPVLGLELTATPQVQNGNKTVLFKNVVYEYPLSQAIKDGYTRTPYALTRRDFNAYNFTPDQIDKVMINDGILNHEKIKEDLRLYAANNHVRLVKPFMLIVCKDTTHAQQVLEYVKSDRFRNGEYRDKVILVHSNQTGEEKEENIQKLLEVEKPNNPVEIVIHVNMLKEGWDVNNLYTIVPLRTATSKTLREQTIGRGLRLPYGVRTGNKRVDSVCITAHDKFDEIIKEAMSGDSIFRADGVVYADYLERKKVVYVNTKLFSEDEAKDKVFSAGGFDVNDEELSRIYREIQSEISENISTKVAQKGGSLTHEEKADALKAAEKDLGERFRDNTDYQRMLEISFGLVGDEIAEESQKRVMYIPRIRTERLSGENYIVQDFDLDLSTMSYSPIANDILVKNLLNSQDEAEIIKGSVIDYESVRPETVLVNEIRSIGEIDYEKCPELIQKIVMQFLDFYRQRYSEKEVRNIVLMYRKDITNHFRSQLLQHLAIKYDDIFETVDGIQRVVSHYLEDFEGDAHDISEAPPTGVNISSIAYRGSPKSITEPFKFDSNPERLFALACDNSPEVIQWLRPGPDQFNITYNRGHRYEPDFVVETSDSYYLVEVKAANKINDPDVIAKKERAIKYCAEATEYNVANGHKGFRYLFIPHDEISSSSSFDNLKARFIENGDGPIKKR